MATTTTKLDPAVAAALQPQTTTTPQWTPESILAAPGAKALGITTKAQAAQLHEAMQSLTAGRKSALTKRLQGRASEIAAKAAAHPNRKGQAPAKATKATKATKGAKATK